MPVTLNADERRVLGVLIEKSYCTPEQYPLTLNAIVVGSNQKSCRDPISQLSEDNVLDALESLRKKDLASLVRQMSGRTDRYRHRATDTWQIEGRDAAVIAELLLRGPQTDGELRTHASRMVPIPGLPELAAIIEKLESRPDPFLRRLSPPGRKRGVKYAHTFYAPGKEPKLEEDTGENDEDGPELSASEPGSASASARGGTSVRSELEELRALHLALSERVDALEARLRDLTG
jgi:uncharacterized protein YceH (UPF0502 family)